jgi:cobalt-zinc-cadmium efflux system outer membrane protein
MTFPDRGRLRGGPACHDPTQRRRRALAAATALAALAAPWLGARSDALASPAVAPAPSASAVTSGSVRPVASVTGSSVSAPATSAAPSASPAPVTSAPAAMPGDPSIPGSLSIDAALEIFRKRGYDLLVADAGVLGAEADEISAGAVTNPSISAGVTKVFTYTAGSVDSCGGCSTVGFSFGLTDNGALIDVFTGKRPLRIKVARAALSIARVVKEDTRRQLELQLKTSLVQLAAAHEALVLANEIAAAQSQTLEISKVKYPRVINEGELARIQTSKLEADRQVELAVQNERVNRASVAFLLGVRGSVPAFLAEPSMLAFTVPAKLAGASQESLVEKARANRPDLKIAGMQVERADAAIDLAKRNRYPDIALSLQYSQIGTGQNALNPPAVTFGVSMPLPLFYNQKGEIRRAEADYGAQKILQQKADGQVVSDVVQGWANFEASKASVERMEKGGLLESAKKARDITQIQFNSGQTTLLDYLDATRTYVGVNVEYVNDRLAYWTSVFQLEAAVGVELRK